MKTMRRGKDIVRVKEKQVQEFLTKRYEFCPKHVWKDEVRVIKKKKEEIKEKLEEAAKEGTTKRGKKSTAPEQ